MVTVKAGKPVALPFGGRRRGEASPRTGWLLWLGAAAACVLAAVVSVSVWKATLSSDPWAWLVWGREVGHLSLSTRHGPVWKPLIVAITTFVALTGSAAPTVWLVIARAASFGSLLAAGRLARRLVGRGAPGWFAAALAVVGVATALGFPRAAISGTSEGVMLLFLFLGLHELVEERLMRALVLGALAGLIRPEVWLLLGVLGLVIMRRDPKKAPYVLGLGLVVIAAWIVPCWLGSGDPLQSFHRASWPDASSYAHVPHPVRAALSDASSGLLPVFWAGLVPAFVLGSKRLRIVGLVGVFLLAEVVVGIVLGEAGSRRYLLPGLAVLAIAGSAGWGLGTAWLATHLPPGRRLAALVLPVLVVAATVASLPRAFDTARGQAKRSHRIALTLPDLHRLIARAGGRARILAVCGRPSTNVYSVTMLAWDLGLPLKGVNAIARPRGVAIQHFEDSGSWIPAWPKGHPVDTQGRWRLLRGSCSRSASG